MADGKPKRNTTHEINDDLWVEFSYPCPKHYGLTRHASSICELSDRNHGHLCEFSSDGAGRVPFPISSRAGFKKMLEVMHKDHSLSASAMQTILALNLDENLPEDLSSEEAEIFADAKKLKDFFSYSLCGV